LLRHSLAFSSQVVASSILEPSAAGRRPGQKKLAVRSGPTGEGRSEEDKWGAAPLLPVPCRWQ